MGFISDEMREAKVHAEQERQEELNREREDSIRKYSEPEAINLVVDEVRKAVNYAYFGPNSPWGVAWRDSKITSISLVSLPINDHWVRVVAKSESYQKILLKALKDVEPKVNGVNFGNVADSDASYEAYGLTVYFNPPL